MIKLIASDLDGTLLHNGEQSLSPRVLELVHRLTEKGIRFIAASAGNMTMNSAFLRELPTTFPI